LHVVVVVGWLLLRLFGLNTFGYVRLLLLFGLPHGCYVTFTLLLCYPVTHTRVTFLRCCYVYVDALRLVGYVAPGCGLRYVHVRLVTLRLRCGFAFAFVGCWLRVAVGWFHPHVVVAFRYGFPFTLPAFCCVYVRWLLRLRCGYTLFCVSVGPLWTFTLLDVVVVVVGLRLHCCFVVCWIYVAPLRLLYVYCVVPLLLLVTVAVTFVTFVDFARCCTCCCCYVVVVVLRCTRCYVVPHVVTVTLLFWLVVGRWFVYVVVVTGRYTVVIVGWLFTRWTLRLRLTLVGYVVVALLRLVTILPLYLFTLLLFWLILDVGVTLPVTGLRCCCWLRCVARLVTLFALLRFGYGC